MKPVLAWIKANWLIVLFGAIILAVLPAAYVVSSSWSASIRESRQKQAEELARKVDSARTTYVLPAYMPGAEGVSLAAAPNPKTTRWFKEEGEKLKALAQGVTASAVEFNKGAGPRAAALGRREHAVLVEGLFPAPASPDQAPLKVIALAEKIAGRRGQTPSVYQQMLDEIRAGGPRDPATLGQQLKDIQDRELERIRGGVKDRRLTPEEEQELSQKLLEARRAAYLRRASEVSVYATMDALPLDSSRDASGGISATIPREIPARPPALWRAFLWQADYWLIRDILDAVRLANTGGDGRLLNVDQSPVKRIERLSIPAPFVGRLTSGGTVDLSPAPAVSEQLGGYVPVDHAFSLTGRHSSSGNPLYDVRRVDLTAIVSVKNLPVFLDAITRTNFMTVIDLDVSEVDPWAELEKGYYYGDESVVRAQLKVETLWLRAWTTPLMPAGVRSRLGLPLSEGMRQESGDENIVPGQGGFEGEGQPVPEEEEPVFIKGGGRGGRGG